LILYRKASSLRVRRTAAPEPPFWCAASIAPYSPKRAEPIAVDYLTARATAAGERVEVTVAEKVRDELERGRSTGGSVLVDAAEYAEVIFRRGSEVLSFCEEQRLPALYLTSTRGALPRRAFDETVVCIAAWPLELPRLNELFDEARTAGVDWGVAVPVIYPITTDLAALGELADACTGARFLAALPVDVDATARQSIAAQLQLDERDDRYAMLFHSDAAPLHLATERHVASLAASRGMQDFIIPPRWEERSNWNASALLTLLASRMIAMELDLDLAGQIARSARAIAELDKPVARIGEAASLSIIGGLDDVSIDVLTEWLAGAEPGFLQYVNEQWRLPRY
jgi:hypothetical protein